MRLKNYFNLFALLVLSLSISAEVIAKKLESTNITKAETIEFSEIEKELNSLNLQYGANSVLVVLDIDNTILTSSVDLGGDIWYQWQRGKLSFKPTESQKVKCLFEDSIGLLYELMPMDLTEVDLPKRIAGWQENNTLMALTSRAPKYRAATERELLNKGIDLVKSALAPIGENAPLYREMKGRELSYMKGIMMTSGMNKGDMIEHILKKTQRKFKAILFVDDSKKNIDAVYKKYESNKDVDMNIFHYVRIEEERKQKYGSVVTEKQIEKMDADWKRLNKLLEAIFPARAKESSCLSL